MEKTDRVRECVELLFEKKKPAAARYGMMKDTSLKRKDRPLARVRVPSDATEVICDVNVWPSASRKGWSPVVQSRRAKERSESAAGLGAAL